MKARALSLSMSCDDRDRRHPSIIINGNILSSSIMMRRHGEFLTIQPFAAPWWLSLGTTSSDFPFISNKTKNTNTLIISNKPNQCKFFMISPSYFHDIADNTSRINICLFSFNPINSHIGKSNYVRSGQSLYLKIWLIYRSIDLPIP